MLCRDHKHNGEVLFGTTIGCSEQPRIGRVMPWSRSIFSQRIDVSVSWCHATLSSFILCSPS